MSARPRHAASQKGSLPLWRKISRALRVLASCAACVLSFVKAPKICLVAANGLAGLLLLVAAIMVFCTVPMAEADGWQLGVGAIFAGIFGIIGALASCGASFFTFKK